MPQAVDMNDPRLLRLVIRIALPAVAGLTASAGHHTINGLFVGALGPEALAGVSLVMPLFLTVSAVGQGLGVGLATLLARHLGAGRNAAASAAASTTFAAALPLGLAFALAIHVALPFYLEGVGASADTLAASLSYGRLLAFGIVFGLLQALGDFVAIAEGNSRFSMTVLIASFGLNILLDPFFIFALDLRESGAALATIVSSFAAVLAYLIYFRRRWAQVRLRLRLVDWPCATPVVKIAIPAAATNIVASLGLLLLLRQASLEGGDEGAAAMAIAVRLMALGQLPILGFCLGAQSVVSHACGAGDPARVQAVVRVMLAAAIGTAMFYSLLLIVAAEPMAGLFTAEDEVVRQTAACLRALVPVFPCSAFQTVLLVLLQSRGKARLSAFIGLAPQGYLLIPALFLMPPWLGFAGVALAPALAAALAGLLGLFVLRREWAALSDLPQAAFR
ncbi:MATE family efflux transporter [Sinorhizobium glycinis]|uniref:Multidrug-efflux transporter n=1 Tax=Sinorhizobium glycinis TaxID=1472378 RepID=A0A178XMG6_9HYPH|nr:MATE family efflux transporter [Sinorhizobium glycinis]OAP36417.1 MATE family efflux transporter [Sinorhizobium glycinis]